MIGHVADDLFVICIDVTVQSKLLVSLRCIRHYPTSKNLIQYGVIRYDLILHHNKMNSKLHRRHSIG